MYTDLGSRCAGLEGSGREIAASEGEQQGWLGRKERRRELRSLTSNGGGRVVKNWKVIGRKGKCGKMNQ